MKCESAKCLGNHFRRFGEDCSRVCPCVFILGVRIAKGENEHIVLQNESTVMN